MIDIQGLKETRAQLWRALDALLAEYKPREDALRAEIKEVQETLYDAEMRPVYNQLREKSDAEGLTEFELHKLSLLSLKFG